MPKRPSSSQPKALLRLYGVVSILVLAGMLAPDGSPWTMLVIAFPLQAVLELGLWQAYKDE